MFRLSCGKGPIWYRKRIGNGPETDRERIGNGSGTDRMPYGGRYLANRAQRYEKKVIYANVRVKRCRKNEKKYELFA